VGTEVAVVLISCYFCTKVKTISKSGIGGGGMVVGVVVVVVVVGGGGGGGGGGGCVFL
jgi:hypothetical protein